MADKRVHAIVRGRVQGVFFRAYTQREAERLSLAGWVRNRADGTVEAAIEGETSAVDEMVRWLHRGSPGARVDEVEIEEEAPLGGGRLFEIRY